MELGSFKMLGGDITANCKVKCPDGKVLDAKLKFKTDNILIEGEGKTRTLTCDLVVKDGLFYEVIINDN